MKVGCFSISLAVKDLQKSKKFYETIGFSVFHGVEDQGWLIMKNGVCNIGLFQGMFEANIMTFNPGWNENAQPVSEFTDIREIQKTLLANNVNIEKTIDEDSSGPASIVIKDPDGNAILFDQHV